MPTTIAQGFAKLRENLEITSLQEKTASDRQIHIRDIVAEEMTVLDSFLTGSYRRSTLIAPLSDADIDIFVVLHHSYYEQNGHASLLDKVKRALAKHYQTSAISRDGQAVTIRFTDFAVDVVPGFNRQGGGYLIPDTVGKRWIETDPKKHVELWAAMNGNKGGNFVPLVKMLKQWNRAHSQLLNSFHLECLIYEVFGGYQIADFPLCVRFFFERAQGLITNGVKDPAGYGGNVGAYLSTTEKRSEVITRLETAKTQAADAQALAAAGKIEQAFWKWQTVFGNYFPAYG